MTVSIAADIRGCRARSGVSALPAYRPGPGSTEGRRGPEELSQTSTLRESPRFALFNRGGIIEGQTRRATGPADFRCTPRHFGAMPCLNGNRLWSPVYAMVPAYRGGSAVRYELCFCRCCCVVDGGSGFGAAQREPTNSIEDLFFTEFEAIASATVRTGIRSRPLPDRIGGFNSSSGRATAPTLTTRGSSSRHRRQRLRVRECFSSPSPNAGMDQAVDRREGLGLAHTVKSPERRRILDLGRHGFLRRPPGQQISRRTPMTG